MGSLAVSSGVWEGSVVKAFKCIRSALAVDQRREDYFSTAGLDKLLAIYCAATVVFTFDQKIRA